ncbi:hypothetical protein A1O1_07017 [Capronia coronata CBS 617.96]|uniref:Aspartate/glutamate racemase family protein n=1 Tax=Capronia coronata CBS 617.96 TaxID=1182541 RepID=W9Y1A8_9EURO|nr:uncharacterized protein A1O1_07017 [Capronia coronata CBS 617.96]EXJ83395.1 hypothetical protein A1O1_07017 [Capronia coronata CBS 617.96]
MEINLSNASTSISPVDKPLPPPPPPPPPPLSPSSSPPPSVSHLPPLGFISVDVHFPRPPGDPFNEQTWPFPLVREQAQGSQLHQIVTKDGYTADFVDRFVEAGQRLIARGCVGIITSCGFLAMAQPELAKRLSVPVATSALIQIPSVHALLPPTQSVGIITFDASKLGALHLSQLLIGDVDRLHIIGVPEDGELGRMVRDGAAYVHERIEEELIQCARDLVERYPDIGALVLECTQMPPFARAIQEAVHLPVYDVYTMGMWFYSGLVRRTPHAWSVTNQS